MVDKNYNTIETTYYGRSSAYPSKWQPSLLDKAKGAKLWMFITVIAVLAWAYFSLSSLAADDDILPPRPQVAFPFLENRERLYGLLVNAVPEFAQVGSKARHENSTVILIPSSRRYTRGESDMEYGGWRQASNVVYVLGEYNIADSLVVLSANVDANVDRGAEGSMIVDVFLPQLSQREVVFSGSYPSPEVLQRENKVSRVFEINDGFADAFEAGTNILMSVPDDAVLSLLGEDTIRKALAKNIRFEYREVVKEAFVESRFVKSESELKLLKYASQVSAKAHQETEKHLQHNHGVSEIELASFFAHRCLMRGSRLQAYPPIVGSGMHAAILHYRTGENTTSGYSPIPKKALVLIDAAGEYQGYASDITRTISRTKHWSKEMKEVYEIVQTVQDTVLESYDVGTSWLELTKLASKTMVEELLRHKFVHGDLKTLLDSGVQNVFMPHGLGHPVGLDVHDPTPAKYEIADTPSTFGISSFLKQFQVAYRTARMSRIPVVSDYQLSAGHITTVEPGLYFVPMLLDMVKDDPDGPGKYINWSKLQNGKYRELGGVRIEDVVMINVDGKKEIISRLQIS